MDSVRKYGKPPFDVVLLHGGPGAPGAMAPVARELSTHWGVLEPLQSGQSVDAQVRELRRMIVASTEVPVRMIGSSWGAMLGVLYTARYSGSVSKLILVGCAPFEEEAAQGIMKTRMERMDRARREEVAALMEKLDEPGSANKDQMFGRMGTLLTEADAFDPRDQDTGEIEYEYRTFDSVWGEAHRMRIRGEFTDMLRHIRCPVVAIHGDHDPHPYAGVHDPLQKCLKDFRSILLERCGHLPWIERYAKEAFFHVLHQELGQTD